MDMMDMGDILRDAVRACGVSMRRLSIESDVNRISLMRFMRGGFDLNLNAASKLAEYFDLALMPVDSKRTRKGA
jgi:plasmid maintenance system antidote protein VapI